MRCRLLIMAMTGLTAGCNLAPSYDRPDPSVPAAWPTGASFAPPAQGAGGVAWRALISDPKLTILVERALAANQNLRATVAGVVAARAQYRIQRSSQFPTVAGNAAASESRDNGVTTKSYSANVGISSFELDLFSRLKNQSKASFETYLATAEGARSTRLTLVGEVATAYATLASDQDILKVAKSTLVSAQQTLTLTQTLHVAGLASAVDMSEAESTVSSVRSDIENDTTQVAQDQNALTLLVGGPIEDALLPTSLADVDGGVGRVPAGLSSSVLLTRPDVLQAEHNLKAEYADIGAARAAFFPTITLTTAAGVASAALSSLFTGGATAWSVAPSATVPIFGGATRGNLAYSKAEKDVYLADYKNAVQTAFKQVADALARAGTIDRQMAAQQDYVAASQRGYDLAHARYLAGSDTFLNALITQRTLYTAQQSALSVRLTSVENRITLYEEIGADPTI